MQERPAHDVSSECTGTAAQESQSPIVRWFEGADGAAPARQEHPSQCPMLDLTLPILRGAALPSARPYHLHTADAGVYIGVYTIAFLHAAD